MPSLPTVGGSTGTWGTELNAFLNVAHNADGTLGEVYRSTHLVRYVDYVNGNDSNSGLSPAAAMKLIQAAYDDLVTVAEATYDSINAETLACGTIYLLPGDHQVGTGVVLDPWRPVEIVGTRSGQNEYRSSSSESRVRTTSSTATEMIRIKDAGSPDRIGVGFTFRNIPFVVDVDVNTNLDSVFYTYRMDFLTMEKCAFSPLDISDNPTIFAWIADTTGTGSADHAWARVIDNRYGHMPFLHFVTGSLSMDRWVIQGNWGGTIGTTPAFKIVGASNDNLIIGNTHELTSTFYSCEGFQKGNCFVDNSGECDDNVRPFIDIAGGGGDVASDNTIIGGRVVVNDNSNGTYVQFGTNCYNNRALGGIISTAGRAGYKAKIVDSSGLLGGGPVQPIIYKAGAAISDSDFAQVPDNGTVGVTYNSSGSVNKIWFRSNGAWVSVTGS